MNPFDKEKLLLSVGELIRRTRLQCDKTKKEIAAHLKITPQAYGNIENGKSDICISRLIEVAKFLEVPIYKFVPEAYYSSIIQFENVDFLSTQSKAEKKASYM